MYSRVGPLAGVLQAGAIRDKIAMCEGETWRAVARDLPAIFSRVAGAWRSLD